MKALGADLGLTLFQRINNNLYPTAAARSAGRGTGADGRTVSRRFIAAPPGSDRST